MGLKDSKKAFRVMLKNEKIFDTAKTPWKNNDQEAEKINFKIIILGKL